MNNKNKLIEQINNTLTALSKSKFRNSFHLKQKEKDYIISKTGKVIKEQAYKIVIERLSPKNIENDGRQTPMKNHPVFIAQHATATCCRKCLSKWHRIAEDKVLTRDEIDYIVRVIMTWIKIEMKGE